MSKVTAKVYCSQKTLTSYNPHGAMFKFAVNYSDGKNKAWAESTPSLDFTMTVKTSDMFEVGKEYTVTFDDDVSE